VKNILQATLPLLFLSACSINQSTMVRPDVDELKLYDGMAGVKICVDANKNEKSPDWFCNGNSFTINDNTYLSILKSEAYISNMPGVNIDYVEDGLTLNEKNNELTFKSSHIIHMIAVEGSDAKRPVVIECRGTVPFIEDSGKGFVSKYCFYEYDKN